MPPFPPSWCGVGKSTRCRSCTASRIHWNFATRLDYSDIQVPPRRATRAVKVAEEFLHRVKEVIGRA